MVAWWSAATGLLQVHDRAADRPPHAVESLDLVDDEPGQLVNVLGLCRRDDVIGPGRARRLRDARQVPERRSRGSGLADIGLDQDVRGDHGNHPAFLAYSTAAAEMLCPGSRVPRPTTSAQRGGAGGRWLLRLFPPTWCRGTRRGLAAPRHHRGWPGACRRQRQHARTLARPYGK